MTLIGREAVIGACRESASHLSAVTTEFRRSGALVAGGRVTAIVSYNVEIGQPEA